MPSCCALPRSGISPVRYGTLVHANKTILFQNMFRNCNDQVKKHCIHIKFIQYLSFFSHQTFKRLNNLKNPVQDTLAGLRSDCIETDFLVDEFICFAVELLS